MLNQNIRYPQRKRASDSNKDFLLLPFAGSLLSGRIPYRTMAKTAKMSDAIVAASQEASMRQSSLPAPLRFPLLVVLSLSLSAVLYSLAATFTAGELSSVSRRLEEWWEVAALVGWKT